MKDEASAQRFAERNGTSRYVPGLSAKLLLLTILFVMLAEVLVFVPSVSNFRRQWLMERLAAAQIASLAAEAAPGGQLPSMLRDELLERAKVKAIAVKHADVPRADHRDGHAGRHRCVLRSARGLLAHADRRCA